ncbi:Ribose operon repressor [Cedecea davisae]|uniref:Sugar-binding domain protein n=2 Tax=Cedecea davisae TaxID=158484 RepID=S3IS99_9ENTR|nr:LacI family DNA-binding transcriptional regulator [Cedecea davisae]EPF15441.1 sugar-binding domain protein [Cedecea davisae DSM 4568]MBU4681396.1 LacI family DNA-binding transcriptional regulator [Cedecea davisae]MBU4686474.1 LacI family DNA-binding transcriptional regulator [Cedecea davisae]SUX38244.1 Ribose operon repressor [Cedecea davisae]
MASLKDVATLAGVSLMTVSRVINQAEHVSPATRERVQRAIDELNYVPDYSARKIRSKGVKASTIGILALDTATTPYSVEMLLAIEQTARERGWNSFLINILSADDAERAVNQLLAQRPDGIIFTTMGLRHVELPAVLKNHRVVLANCTSGDAGLPSYIPDDFNGQYQATRYLIEQGYRRPLCLWLPSEALASRPRRDGFEQAWREAGLDVEAVKQYHMQWGDAHYPELAECIAGHSKDGKADFDVLVCGNDRIAFVAYQKLLAQGIALPEQVAVLGFDNLVGVGDLFLPPLTTVQLPHEEIGRQAALHLIDGLTSGGVKRLPCPLVKRVSL